MDKVELGKIVKLHGYLGGVKVRTIYDKDFNIKSIKKVYDKAENEYEVERIFQTKDGVVIQMKNVGLEQAKTMIGNSVFIDREVVGEKILIEDLKGSVVKLENEKLVGKIVDVQDYGSAEVFFVKTEKGTELMFPNVKNLIVNFDVKNKILVVNESKLKEVSDYEN